MSVTISMYKYLILKFNNNLYAPTYFVNIIKN